MPAALRRLVPLGLLLLGGCGWLTPPPTSSGITLPGALDAAAAAAPVTWPDPEWWRGFGAPELDALMAEAIAANTDIAGAIARIRQADAQLRISGSALVPTLDISGRASRQQSGGANAASVTGVGRTARLRLTASDQLSLATTYEVDFWGKTRAAVESSAYSLRASRFDAGVVTLTTQASVANTYFGLLSAQERLALQRQNLEIAERVLRVYRDRLAAGTGTGLDLAQQETVVAQQRAQIPPLEQEVAQNRNSLGTLLARPPETLRVAGGGFRRITVPAVQPGLPADVLARRPDVLQAEASLAAANANIVVARAALLPSLSLTGSGGYTALALETLTRPSSIVFNLAASLTQRVFDGGALRGQVRLNEAQAEELLATYRGTIIAALVDVENALVALRQTTEQERLQAEAVRMAERSYTISEAQLRAGTIDILTVLNTQQTLFSARTTLAQARLSRLQAAVGLFKALGGGWTLPG